LKGGVMKNKTTINFVIDASMFVCIMAMAGIGFLMKFVLMTGRERWVKYGRNVYLSFLGMDRHDWATIHLVIGFVLLVLLVLHTIFHWKMIMSMYCKLIDDQRTRRIVASVFLIVSAVLILFPFIMNL